VYHQPTWSLLALSLSTLAPLGCGTSHPVVDAPSTEATAHEPATLRLRNVLSGDFDVPFKWLGCGDQLVVISASEPRQSHHTTDLEHWSQSPLPTAFGVLTSACIDGTLWAAGRNGLILRHDPAEGWVTEFEYPTHHEFRDRSTHFTRIEPGPDAHPSSVLGMDANGQAIAAVYDATSGNWTVREVPRDSVPIPGYYPEGESPCDHPGRWRRAARDLDQYEHTMVCSGHLILLEGDTEGRIDTLPLPSSLDASYAWTSELDASRVLVWRTLYRTDPSTVDFEEDVLYDEEEEQLNRSEIALYEGGHWLVSEVEGRVFTIDTWRSSLFVAMTTGLHQVVLSDSMVE
jgi:hypothetical protein